MGDKHQARPKPAAGMSPQTPRDVFDFGMPRRIRKVAERLPKPRIGTVARVAPQPTRLARAGFVTGTDQPAVPLACQRLPVQIVGRGQPARGRAGTASVLMHNQPAKTFNSRRDPQKIVHEQRQFALFGGCRKVDRMNCVGIRSRRIKLPHRAGSNLFFEVGGLLFRVLDRQAGFHTGPLVTNFTQPCIVQQFLPLIGKCGQARVRLDSIGKRPTT